MIACSVVTYKPTAEQLVQIENLREFLPVIVVDNTVKNRGIAWALNESARQALSQGYEWLLMLDQDASLSSSQWDSYKAEFDGADKTNVAIFAPNGDSIVAMTNGSIMNLRIWSKLSGYHEPMFIDEVDNEYCLRAIKNGYKVVRLETEIEHHPGIVKFLKTIKGNIARVGSHPPTRLYYIYRNYWYMRRYRDDFPEFLSERKRLLWVKFREYVLYHPNKLRSVFAMLRGTLDGMFWREYVYEEMTRERPSTT